MCGCFLLKSNLLQPLEDTINTWTIMSMQRPTSKRVRDRDIAHVKCAIRAWTLSCLFKKLLVFVAAGIEICLFS